LNGKKKEFVRTVKFALFSASAGVIQFLSFTLFNELLCMRYFWAYLISLTLSVLWNFTLNRKFTFHSAANVPVAMLKVAAFYAVFTPLSSWFEHYLTMTCGWNEYLATFTNMVINLVTEFFYQRFFVFGSSIDTAKKEQ
jgi:putative flippase GtrA